MFEIMQFSLTFVFKPLSRNLLRSSKMTFVCCVHVWFPMYNRLFSDFVSGAINTTPSVIIVQYPLGRRFEKEVPPHSFWRTQFYMSNSEFVKFNFSVPSYAVIGVYGRKNVQPTHAQYDFFHVLDGNKILLMDGGRQKRSSNVRQLIYNLLVIRPFFHSWLLVFS